MVLFGILRENADLFDLSYLFILSTYPKQHCHSLCLTRFIFWPNEVPVVFWGRHARGRKSFETNFLKIFKKFLIIKLVFFTNGNEIIAIICWALCEASPEHFNSAHSCIKEQATVEPSLVYGWAYRVFERLLSLPMNSSLVVEDWEGLSTGIRMQADKALCVKLLDSRGTLQPIVVFWCVLNIGFTRYRWDSADLGVWVLFGHTGEVSALTQSSTVPVAPGGGCSHPRNPASSFPGQV